MDSEQAKDILEHLVHELQQYGYGEVIRQVRTKLEEKFEEGIDQREYGYRWQLNFYLDTSIEVLRNLSSANLKNDLALINENLETGKITKVQVELVNDTAYDLSELPDYSRVINMLKSIQIQINNQ